MVVAGAVASFLAAADAGAGEPAQKLSGDWSGRRTELAAGGLEFQIGYTEEVAGNTQGGAHRYTRAAGQLALGATLDLQRLFGWQGATVQVTLTNRNGRNLSADAGLNTLQQVQEVYGRGDIWRLTQFWFEQRAFDDVLSVKLGRLTVGEDFAAFSCNFQNLTFCGSSPGNLAGDYWYNWPVSQWGARLRLGNDQVYLKAGAYNVSPRNADPDRGFYLGVGETRGALLPVELGWTPTLNGLPGKYTLTLWYNSAHADDLFYNRAGLPLAVDGGDPRRVQGRYGVSVQLQQQLTQPDPSDAARGLGAFLNFTQTDRRTTQTDNQIAAGIAYTGWFASRPRDVLAIALGRTQLNGRYAQTRALEGLGATGWAPRRSAEYVAEAYYNLNIYPGLDVRPNMQLIHRPGGVNNAKGIVVIGLKAVINL